MTDQKLTELFSPFGQVNSARISIDPNTKENLSYGYVEMENEVEGQKAIKDLDGFTIENSKIGVAKVISTYTK